MWSHSPSALPTEGIHDALAVPAARHDEAHVVLDPDPHFHRTISVAFFVLFGVVRLCDGDRGVEATAPDFLYLLPGGI